MSEPENFLARWARRKREVAEEEAKATPSAAEPPCVAEGDVSDSQSEPADAPATPARPHVDPEDLPPVESITAGTDLAPFLAPGVPPDIVRAALRRAWSADPKIRDFIGLSENAWDFNQPGAMGGFGALEMTDDVRRMVARIVGEAVTEDLPTELPAPGEAEISTEKLSGINPSGAISPTATDDGKLGSIEDSNPVGQVVAACPAALATPRQEDIATQYRPAKPEISPKTVRRGHGGALPK